MMQHAGNRSAGKGGGGCPSNVLQDHFSNSSNSGVKIAGGGVRPMSFAIIMCISIGFCNIAILSIELESLKRRV